MSRGDGVTFETGNSGCLGPEKLLILSLGQFRDWANNFLNHVSNGYLITHGKVPMVAPASASAVPKLTPIPEPSPSPSGDDDSLEVMDPSDVATFMGWLSDNAASSVPALHPGYRRVQQSVLHLAQHASTAQHGVKWECTLQTIVAEVLKELKPAWTCEVVSCF